MFYIMSIISRFVNKKKYFRKPLDSSLGEGFIMKILTIAEEIT